MCVPFLCPFKQTAGTLRLLAAQTRKLAKDAARKTAAAASKPTIHIETSRDGDEHEEIASLERHRRSQKSSQPTAIFPSATSTLPFARPAAQGPPNDLNRGHHRGLVTETRQDQQSSATLGPTPSVGGSTMYSSSSSSDSRALSDSFVKFGHPVSLQVFFSESQCRNEFF